MKKSFVAFVIVFFALGLFLVSGCSDKKKKSKTQTPSVLLSFERIKTGAAFPPFDVVITANDAKGAPASGLSVIITSSLGTVGAVIDNGDGSYVCRVTPPHSGEALISATVAEWEITVQRTAAVMMFIHDDWGQPVSVDGPYVNTSGYADSPCVSPDGEWLLILYSPMQWMPAGAMWYDTSLPEAQKAVGPYDAPLRPDFFNVRISETGSLTHSYPLLGVGPGDLPTTIPMTSLYGFRRQTDGRFGSPFLIGYNDSGNGCVGGGFGPSIVMKNTTEAVLAIGFDDPLTHLTSGVDILTADVEFGSTIILGEYLRDSVTTEITVQNQRAMRVGIDLSGHNGNPHLFANSSNEIVEIWYDEEAVDHDIYVSTLQTGGLYPAGPWSAPLKLPEPVNTASNVNVQPFFTGNRLYFSRDYIGVVYSDYLGGGYENAASWSDVNFVFLAEASGDTGKIASAGEPSLCEYNGKTYLYFLYVFFNADGHAQFRVGYVEKIQ